MNGAPGNHRDLEHACATAFKKRLGRGPTRISLTETSDLVMIRAEGVLDRYHQTLAAGNEDLAIEVASTALKELAKTDLVHMIEESVGRRVEATLESQSLCPDVALITFLLEEQEACLSAVPPDPATSVSAA